MRINDCYMNIEDALSYNILYAPDYPEEDSTDIDKEYKQLMQYLNDLLKKVKSDYKIGQLKFAEKDIEKAFLLYKPGKDGQKNLEEALEYVEYSKRIKPLSPNFIIDPSGNFLINADENSK